MNWAWYTQTADPDGLGVTYEFSDGHTVVRKAFRFEKDSYLSHVSTRSRWTASPSPDMIEWRGGFGDLTVANPAGSQRALYFDVTQQQAGREERRRRQERSGHRGRQFLLRRHRRHVLRRRLPARKRHHVTRSRFAIRCAPRSRKNRRLQRRGGLRWPVRTTSSCSSAPRISSCLARSIRSSAGGGFRLALHPGQAAVPGGQLVQRRVRPQLRLVDRAWSPSSSTSFCSRSSSRT